MAGPFQIMPNAGPGDPLDPNRRIQTAIYRAEPKQREFLFRAPKPAGQPGIPLSQPGGKERLQDRLNYLGQNIEAAQAAGATPETSSQLAQMMAQHDSGWDALNKAMGVEAQSAMAQAEMGRTALGEKQFTYDVSPEKESRDLRLEAARSSPAIEQNRLAAKKLETETGPNALRLSYASNPAAIANDPIGAWRAGVAITPEGLLTGIGATKEAGWKHALNAFVARGMHNEPDAAPLARAMFQPWANELEARRAGGGGWFEPSENRQGYQALIQRLLPPQGGAKLNVGVPARQTAAVPGVPVSTLGKVLRGAASGIGEAFKAPEAMRVRERDEHGNVKEAQR